MGEFIYFTDEQKERANAVSIADILQKEHEEVERSGNEWRWKRHKSVTFRGNSWYRHSQQVGSHAIDFMQEFFGMTYPEAVTYLLDGETGQVIHGGAQGLGRNAVSNSRKRQEQAGKGQMAMTGMSDRDEKPVSRKERKILVPPEKSDTMKRVYAYLMQKRHISRDILSFFARQGTLYESKEYHNTVFAGLDKDGNIRHVHIK